MRNFPFDRIKIDGNFVRDIGDQRESLAIVRAVCGLASSLGIMTTAEGVETPLQLQRVRDEGCAEAQGYLFSHPVPLAEVDTLLGRRLTVPRPISSAQAKVPVA